MAVSFQDFFFRAVAANASSGLHSAPSTASKAIRRRSVWAGRGAAPPEFCGGPTGDRLMLKRQQEGAAMFDPTRLGRGSSGLSAELRIPVSKGVVQFVVEDWRKLTIGNSSYGRRRAR